METHKKANKIIHIFIMVSILTLILSLIAPLYVFAGSVTVYTDEELQKALRNKKIDTIFISPGTYYGNFTIKKRKNVSIIGLKNVIIKPSNNDKPVLSILGPRTPGYRKSNITLSNIKILGNFKKGKGLFIRNYTKIYLRNITVENFSTGIHFYGVTHSIIEESNINKNIWGVYMEPGNTHHFFKNIIASTNFTNNEIAIKLDDSESLKKVLDIENCKIKITKKYWKENDSAPGGIWSYYDNEIEISNISLEYPYPNDCAPTVMWKNKPDSERNFGGEYISLSKEIEEIYNEYKKDMDYISANFCTSKEDRIYKESLLILKNFQVQKVIYYKKKYLINIKEVNRENIGCILDFIETLILTPPYISILENKEIAKVNLKKEVSFEIADKNNIIRDYFIPLFWYFGDPLKRIKDFLSSNLYIDSKPIIDWIPDSPKVKVEKFRKNLIIYNEYMENVKLAKYWMKRVSSYIIQGDILSYEDTEKIKHILDSLERISYLKEKIVRMELFDIPLAIILLEIEKEIKKAGKDKELLKDIGLKFSSYTPIKIYATVSDAMVHLWEGINKEFKKKLKSRDFEELIQRAKTSPLWLKNQMKNLISE